jgi:hypothetical protein
VISLPDEQLIVGTTNDLGSVVEGNAVRPWAVASASRIAVALPSFDTQGVGDLFPATIATMTKALGAAPQQPERFTVNYTGGRLIRPLETLTSAFPAPTDPDNLAWASTAGLRGVTYVIFDQAADDAARNRLFVVAILLGTAAAKGCPAMTGTLDR